MKEITGTIDHRILLNYRVDPAVLQRWLPPEFRPKLVNGSAIGGICQVSLSGMRPKGMPRIAATRSHNAAHRIAVTSSRGDGVYVARRDTDSRLNVLSGGRLFPGVYAHASFEVSVDGDRYVVRIDGDGGRPLMRIDATVVPELPAGSTFADAAEVSSFFETGNVGWSPRKDGHGFDAIELATREWRMEPLAVQDEFSAFFSDEERFPRGSVELDSAMIMRDLEHSWISRANLCDVCT